MDTQIDIIMLPPSRWQENRDLRLRALVNDPTAYGSTYQEDAALPDERWIQWVQDAQEGKTYLLFAEHEHTLIGMVGAVVGKGTKKQHSATLVAMYVELAFRGKGVGKQLLQALLERLSANPSILVVDLYVNTQASVAINLYERMGFKQTGVHEKTLYSDGVFSDLAIMTKMAR